MQDEHDDGMHGISQEGQVRLAAQHDRDDQPHLDHCYSERQHQCAVGFAHPQRHNFRMVHGGDHIAEEHRGEHQRKHPQTYLANHQPCCNAKRGQECDVQRNAIDRGHRSL